LAIYPIANNFIASLNNSRESDQRTLVLNEITGEFYQEEAAENKQEDSKSHTLNQLTNLARNARRKIQPQDFKKIRIRRINRRINPKILKE